MFSKTLFSSQRQCHGKHAELTKLESNAGCEWRAELGITEKWVLRTRMSVWYLLA